MSGFGANLVLTQFIEQGPSVAATVLQIIPSMGLFRGVSPCLPACAFSMFELDGCLIQHYRCAFLPPSLPACLAVHGACV